MDTTKTRLTINLTDEERESIGMAAQRERRTISAYLVNLHYEARATDYEAEVCQVYVDSNGEVAG